LGADSELPLVVGSAVPNLRLNDAAALRLDVLAWSFDGSAASPAHLVAAGVVGTSLMGSAAVDDDFAAAVHMN